LWEWSDDGRAEMGAYWGDGLTIQSPSVGNGCALFNSDFLDNDGIAGNFGMGPSGGPHVSELVSPIIDCSAYPLVTLQFYQSYRNFNTDPRVEVSNDAGATWTSFPVNEYIYTNESADPGGYVLVPIAEVAGGSPTVQFKFVFDGYYYFWLVDDVRLIETPINLEIPRAALSVLHSTPVTQLVEMEIDAEVCNFAEQENVTFNCTITNSGTGDVVYNSAKL